MKLSFHVLDPTTYQPMLGATFAAGDVQISIGGDAFADATNLPAYRQADSVTLDLILTEAESVEGAEIVLADQSDPVLWIGPNPILIDNAAAPLTLSQTENAVAGGLEGFEEHFDDTIAGLSQQIAGISVSGGISYVRRVHESLRVVRGDRHNGVDAPKLSFATDKEYDSKPVTLLIFDNSETVLAQGVGTADGEEVIIDDIQLEFESNQFSGNPLTAKLHYVIVAGTKETIRSGRCDVSFRPDID
jgi:hypothetical protein